MVSTEDYRRLIGAFVREELAAGDFVLQFLERFKADDRAFDERSFASLDELFGIADSFTTDLELLAADPSFYVAEDRLRKESERILVELGDIGS